MAPIRDQGGRVTHFISLQRDISRRVAAESERRLLVLALDEIADEVLITDDAGLVTYANRAFRERAGLSQTAAQGRPAPPLDPERQQPEALASLWRRLRRGERHAVTYTELDRDGVEIALEQSIAPVRDEAGRIRQYVLTGRDVTGRLQAERELRRLATTDPLTGLNNRLRFEVLAERELNRARRHDGRLGLVLFDLDGFKAVNDRFGHEAGDRVLVELAVLVTDNVRGEDILGRWGGEEFTLLLPALDIAGARQAAEKLRALVAGHRFPGVGGITASFGVTEAVADDSVRSMLRRADTALYRAKDGRKNRVETLAGEPAAQPGNKAE